MRISNFIQTSTPNSDRHIFILVKSHKCPAYVGFYINNCISAGCAYVYFIMKESHLIHYANAVTFQKTGGRTVGMNTKVQLVEACAGS